MLKKIIDVIKKNFILIIIILLFILLCFYIKDNYMEFVNNIDNYIYNFFNTKIITDANTKFMKGITFLGEAIIVILSFFAATIFFKNKIISKILLADLSFIGALCWILKNSFKRIRPVTFLINSPNSYSFPSGHTFFAFGFYGLIVYFMWKIHTNKFYKYILTFTLSLIIVFIGISRIYLGVHHFSDVVAGCILGILTLILFIKIYLTYDWGWKK